MSVWVNRKTVSSPLLSVFIMAALLITIAIVFTMSGSVQPAYADSQETAVKAAPLKTQAAIKKLTAKGTYTFVGATGKTSITSKSVKGKCTKGTLTLKKISTAYKSGSSTSWKKLSGKSFKISVAKNCKFYVAGMNLTSKTAKSAIKQLKSGQVISLQVIVSGGKTKKIIFGAW